MKRLVRKALCSKQSPRKNGTKMQSQCQEESFDMWEEAAQVSVARW